MSVFKECNRSGQSQRVHALSVDAVGAGKRAATRREMQPVEITSKPLRLEVHLCHLLQVAAWQGARCND
jgi:hypothetical protein